ncbi:hypothetical protein CcrC1_gp135 [Caulobacter phage C1]|nr:hypothetical protein CcrC1_gp135 [Caulobacter phage C1]UTU08364.1 hypothetical protein CcrC2_gp136 [Caulobacter phage C2]UTU08881.1 hypothetical protein CcrJ4_gp130 [Caulobacter phage J4]UTU09437.1 hypothetical protein CcrBL47_gp151 [Caulobacter phage BL47]UTU09997.1 hypothetical protein CcrRB23_gp135 [Caulobacter phage RB23]WGN97022.1 hypothetical protein [Bertelyvirus sp.]
MTRIHTTLTTAKPASTGALTLASWPASSKPLLRHSAVLA